MNLRTATPYWLMKNGYVNAYPACRDSVAADVVVVGGGITGALTAYELASAGLHVIVLDKRHPGEGSTCASTALLQYEIDEPLHKLARIAGKKRAEKSYIACYEAIDNLSELVEREGIDADFRLVSSLQYASYKKDVSQLQEELEYRRTLHFDLEMLGPEEIQSEYGFHAPAALLSTKGGCVDAYKLAHGLLGLPIDALEVYDLAEVSGITDDNKGVRVELAGGARINAGYAILACGYETLPFLPFPVAEVGATYALASKPIPAEKIWKDHSLVWETKDPYIYIRTTADNRIIAGGRDDDTNNPQKRNTALPRKIKGLLDDMHELFPDIDIIPDYVWAGAFSSTKDSLGYTDAIPGRPRVYCNLGFGGNGILYSLIGAQILRDRILGRSNDYDDIFLFDR